MIRKYCYFWVLMILSPSCLLAQQADLAGIELLMKKVKSNLFAAATECSNREYRVFLRMMQDSPQYSSYVPDSRQWLEMNSRDMGEQYHQQERYDDFPVVNISQQAARKYCEWLSLQYNNWPERKFKKVKFRLPAENEWKQAARGLLPEGALLPWDSYNIKNEENYYRCNYNLLAQASPDTVKRVVPGEGIIIGRIMRGPFYMTKVRSYWPNNIGLYNVLGNVAEMLDSPGRTKGGSWNSQQKFISIEAPDEYNGFSTGKPYIGFRLFMEVLEY